MPILAGVPKPDGLAVDELVGEDHDLRRFRLLEGIGHVDFQRAEILAECPELQRGELLRRETEHAVLTEQLFDFSESFRRQRPGQVDLIDPCAQPFATWGDIHLARLLCSVRLADRMPALHARPGDGLGRKGGL